MPTPPLFMMLLLAIVPAMMWCPPPIGVRGTGGSGRPLTLTLSLASAIRIGRCLRWADQEMCPCRCCCAGPHHPVLSQQIDAVAAVATDYVAKRIVLVPPMVL